MDYDRTDLAWVSGLFEGEGTIGRHKYTSGLEQPQVSLASTDEDVVRAVLGVLGFGTITLRPPKPGELRKLPLWQWNANSFENCQAAIAMFWPYLKQRRRARAVEVFTIVRDSQIHRKTMRRGSECSEDGCTKPVQARGLCGAHYQSIYYKKRVVRAEHCVIDGCARRPNGSRGECRAHTDARKKAERG